MEAATRNLQKPAIITQHPDYLLDGIHIDYAEVCAVIINMEAFIGKLFSGLGIPIVFVAKTAQKTAAGARNFAGCNRHALVMSQLYIYRIKLSFK